MNTLFNTSLYPPKERKQPSLDFAPKTVSIQSISADIEENGVRLRLTVVDTPGFGDFVNNDDSWRPIVENIEQRFDAYLDAENKVNRMNIVDNRVHACVYFVQPTGHSLKPLDVEVMRRLHTKVNLIPVIAKADTLTDDEIAAFKQRVSAEDEIASKSLAADTTCYRFLQTSITTISTSSKAHATSSTTRRLSQRTTRSCQKCLLPLSALTPRCKRQKAAKCVVAAIRGVLSKSTTKSTATLSNSDKCSSGLIWRS